MTYFFFEFINAPFAFDLRCVYEAHRLHLYSFPTVFKVIYILKIARPIEADIIQSMGFVQKPRYDREVNERLPKSVARIL